MTKTEENINYKPKQNEILMIGWRNGTKKMIVTNKKEDVKWFANYCDTTEYKGAISETY